MIQELFGVAGLIGENKFSINGGILDSTTTTSTSLISPSLSSSSTARAATTTTAITTTTSTTSSGSEGQNLRCPRCDSSNTKFCYYNNYNLTQPRHFCKTCRRYWTKGGALRNVPIGGGCRKNKSVATVAASVAKSSAGKLKTLASEFGRVGFGAGFDQNVPPSQILWGSPQNSHLLAILRSATQNPNPNLNQSPLHNGVALKGELATMDASHMVNEPVAVATSAFHGRTMSFDPVNHLPSLGLCSSYWRNNQNQVQQQNGMAVSDQMHNNGIQELYQKLRSSSTNYFADQPTVSMTNVASTSAILESAPVAGGETGYWNPAFSWSDLHTSTNGSYP